MNFTVVIPAYNEEALLGETLRSLHDAMENCGRSGRVIVVDNASTDATPDVARAHGADVVFEPLNQIARARNAGAAAADSPALVFLDADTRISGSLLDRALSRLDSGEVCGGGSVIAMDRSTPEGDRILKVWNWLSVKRRLAAGSFVFCRRDAFEAVGGFNEKVYAGEEIYLSRKLRRWGRKHGREFVILEGTPPVTSARKMDWYSVNRMAWRTLMLGLFPFLLRFKRLCWPWYRRPGQGNSP